MSIEQRMERLERQNQRLKKGMIGMVLAGISLLIMGQALQPKVHDLIRARNIHIVSKEGQRVVSMGSSEYGGWIFTYGSKGNHLIRLDASIGANGTLTTYSSEGKKLVDLGSTEGDTAGVINTYNLKGRRLVSISSDGDGHGTIQSFNSQGNRGVKISSDDNGGMIASYGHQGKIVFGMSVNNKGRNQLATFNSQGKQVTSIGTTDDDAGNIFITDANGTHLIGILSDKNGNGRVVQYNRAGKPQAVWPPLR